MPLLALVIGLSTGPNPAAIGAQTQSTGATVSRGTPQAPKATLPGQRPDGGRRGDPCADTTVTNAICLWWRDTVVKKELGLSDEKSRRIERIYQDRVRAEQPFADEYYKERDVLNQMTEERKASLAVYSLQVSKVLALETKLRETRTVMLYRMFLELTPEQNAKLKALQAQQRERGRGGRGPHSK